MKWTGNPGYRNTNSAVLPQKSELFDNSNASSTLSIYLQEAQNLARARSFVLLLQQCSIFDSYHKTKLLLLMCKIFILKINWYTKRPAKVKTPVRARTKKSSKPLLVPIPLFHYSVVHILLIKVKRPICAVR